MTILLLREGIAALVNAEPDEKLVAEASDVVRLIAARNANKNIADQLAGR